MNKFFNPVILAGGIGSRLWPLSRADYPKQFQELLANKKGSLLQQTFSRLVGLNTMNHQLICNQNHRFLAAEQCREDGIKSEIILEPVGRSTAAAVILAALNLAKKDSDEPMLILSADHSISNITEFHKNLLNAYELAISGYIVTIGIRPTYPSIGYGYIKYAESLGSGFIVENFVEKPDIINAKQFLESGDFLWNSGIFIVKPSILLEEAEMYCPKLLELCKTVFQEAKKDLDFIRLPSDTFSKCEDISIDYAIMEQTKKALVIKGSFVWNDVGDINAIWQINEKDKNGNVIHGDAIAIDTKDCLIRSESRLLTVLGAEKLGVIETADSVLVIPLDKAQQVKDLISALKNRDEIITHREVFRPWGSYDSVDSGKNYQVKRITVNPGSKLSLQRHKYRAEHWVVVDGNAKVHLDGKDYNLKTNDSIYIPLGAIHSLANESNSPLKLVEVQSGGYLGEDDIERLDDIYGRIEN